MIRSRRKPDKPDGGPLLLAVAILERMVEDAQRFDQRPDLKGTETDTAAKFEPLGRDASINDPI